MTKPTPPLPTRAKAQGGFLPRIQQKAWKHQLKIHHTIRKAIRIACQQPYTHLQHNPDIQSLILVPTINTMPLPTNQIEHIQWIDKQATIGKNAKIQAHKIVTKQTSINCRTAITKYKTLLNIKQKTIHKKIFHPTTANSLDCIQSSKGHILTKLIDISNKIYHIQQTSFQRQAPLYEDTIDHSNTCMCAIRKYPWYIYNGIIFDKRGPHNTLISIQFTQEIYDKCVKRLTREKAPGPDNIPNHIIKILPP